MAVDVYEIGVESPELIEVFPSGRTVTVAVYNRATGAAVSLSSAACTEIGATGMYRWSGSNFTSAPSSGRNKYSYVMTESTNGLQRFGAFDWRDYDQKFDGVVYIDTVNGVSGTSYPTGTEFQPVDNLADAVTIATRINSNTFHLRGSITLSGNFAGKTFRSDDSTLASVALNNQVVTDAIFCCVALSGQQNGPITTHQCEVAGVMTGVEGVWYDVLLNANITLESASALRIIRGQCLGSAEIEVDCNGDGSVTFTEFTHFTVVKNLTNAAKAIIVQGPSTGLLTLDSTVTNGIHVIAGDINLVDNSTGSFVQILNMSHRLVWKEARTDNQVAGSFGEYTLADLVRISGDDAAADNLEAQYDGTGYFNDVAPAYQSQLDQLSVGGGAALNTPANANSTVVTGSTVSGDYTDTAQLDGVYWRVEDTAGTIDMYLEFDVGTVGVPTGGEFTGRLNGINDDVVIQAYNWTTLSWEQVGQISGKATTVDDSIPIVLYTTHVGTGADIGRVRVRFFANTLTAADLYIDRLFVSYSQAGSVVGYSMGAIWVDTLNGAAGAVRGVNGVADNPVDNWADAVTLSGLTGLTRFRINGGSVISLTGDSSHYCLEGFEWSLDVNGQNIHEMHVLGATVTGTTVSGDYARFMDCKIGNITVPQSGFGRCAFGGTFTAAAAGTFLFEGCFSAVAGTGSPVYDFAAVGATGFNFRHHSGGVDIRNMAAGDTMSLEGEGQLIIDASCTGGVVAIRGEFDLTDNSGGAVALSDDARLTLSGIQAEILSDATPFDGADVGQILSDTSVMEPLVSLNLDAKVSDVETDTQDIQGRLPASLVSGRMDSDVGNIRPDVVDATALATDAIDADALAADAVAEIQSGLATSVEVASIQADTDDIQTRLPASLVAGRMDSDVGAMQTDTVDANALAADAVAEIDAALSAAHGSGSWETDSGEYRVLQSWVNRSVTPAGMYGAVRVELEKQLEPLPTATLALEFLLNGATVHTVAGLSPNADGYWDVVIDPADVDPAQGTLLVVIATVTDSGDSYVGMTGLSVPEE